MDSVCFNPHRPFRAGATVVTSVSHSVTPQFQSSPALSGRCNTGCWPRVPVVSFRFNPHRPFRAGATRRPPSSRSRSSSFNPHRPFRAGATTNVMAGTTISSLFQSSPALSGRCNLERFWAELLGKYVSILTGPFGPVQPDNKLTAGQVHIVSILTGPFGPVQHRYSHHRARFAGVSILTGPFGPVQRALLLRPGARFRGFNPHRPFRAGATSTTRSRPRGTVVSILTGPFGPVQLPRAPLVVLGAGVSILTGPFGPVQRFWRCWSSRRTRCFNPHRPFRAGATHVEGGPKRAVMTFQSSPALSGRCNHVFRRRPDVRLAVSILTGPFGPVQPAAASMAEVRYWPFQSSPALSGRCNAGHSGERVHPDSVSILTGPFGPVQRAATASPSPSVRSFQSSPALSGRCNGGHRLTFAERQVVSILTGPFGPVQPGFRRPPGPRTTRFNPHRPFRAGATYQVAVQKDGNRMFQSSPALSGRCNCQRNLQRQARWCFNPHRPFRAGATRRTARNARLDLGFNPHRPFRAGATTPNPTHPWSGRAFQSSPALSGRCNILAHKQFPAVSVFQSSPALSGRCNGDGQIGG